MIEEKYTLTPDQAQKYVNQLMEDVPYNINIIDKNGIIIASGDPNRIGDFHSSGQKAFEKKAKVMVYVDQNGERKGANEPVMIQGEIICIVGISGDPKEVQNYTKLLSSMIKLLIEQEHDAVISMKEAQKDELFINEIAQNSDEEYTKEIIELARKRYHLDLAQSVKVFVANEQHYLKSLANLYKTTIFNYRQYSIVILNTDVLTQQYSSPLLTGPIFMDKGTNIANALNNIFQTIAYFKMFHINIEEPVYIKNYSYYLLNTKLVRMDEAIYDKVTKLDDELMTTLAIFVKNNLDTKATSEEMFIHRNTVNYRLEKIHRITELNPRNITDLFVLVLYIVDKFED